MLAINSSLHDGLVEGGGQNALGLQMSTGFCLVALDLSVMFLLP